MALGMFVVPTSFVAAQPPGRAEQAADMQLFHYLLSHGQDITRKVTKLDNGVETVTESDKPEVAAAIQKHVDSMHQRLKDKRPIHMRDPLFAAIFRNADKIHMTVERTKGGVKVKETSDDKHVARIIQAHAEVLNLFIKNGHFEMRRNHAVPPAPDDKK
jgi:hypothetical protein